MTGPAPVQGYRDGNGYLHMPEGYVPGGADARTQQATPQQVALQQQQIAQQQQNALPAFMQQGAQGNAPPGTVFPPSASIDGTGSPLANLAPVQFPQRQMQQQAPQPAQQPQNAPQQQFQQMPVQQPQGVDLNARLSGPGVPQELQGRTLGEVVQLNQGLRNATLTLMQQASQQQTQQPVQQPAARPQEPAAPASGFDWKNPDASIGRVVEEKITNAIQSQIMPMMAPIAAQNNIQSIQSAEAQAAAEWGQDWAQMRPLVAQALNGADPRALMNPQTWAVAARAVYGNQMFEARRNQQQPLMRSPNAPGAHPAQQVAYGQQPVPNMNSFFSEQPTQGGPQQNAVQLSPMQDFVRQQVGMDVATYSAWLVGQPAGAR